MNISVKLATIDEKKVISTLLQPYLEELSHYPGEVLEYRDARGTYYYPYLDDYWRENQRYPYLLYGNNRVAGFALVRRNRGNWEMAEYYVLPEFRRCGLGIGCAIDIVRQHPGKWKIYFNKNNRLSRILWYKLAKSLARDISTGELNASHAYVRFSY
jgi:predicted acetyltransferase